MKYVLERLNKDGTWEPRYTCIGPEGKAGETQEYGGNKFRLAELPSEYECTQCHLHITDAHHDHYPLCLKCWKANEDKKKEA